MRVWRKRGSCRSPEKPWAWVQEITRNEAKRMLSRRAMTHELPTADLPETPTDSGEDAMVARLDVERALDHLSPADRMLVRLRYQRDLTHPKVASTLGLTETNVKVRLHRLRTKLERALPAP